MQQGQLHSVAMLRIEEEWRGLKDKKHVISNLKIDIIKLYLRLC